MPKGFRKDGTKLGFQKGNHPKTEFKKGHLFGVRFGRDRDISRENHPRWKGGKINKRGYVMIHLPNHPFCDKRDGYIYEHRLIIEKQIGRYLHRWEVVHHIGKKDDNRPHMLMAFINHSAHMKFERGTQIEPEKIIFNGKTISDIKEGGK